MRGQAFVGLMMWYILRRIEAALTPSGQKEQTENETADGKRDAEDDETDAVDDCCRNHPSTHHLLVPVILLT